MNLHASHYRVLVAALALLAAACGQPSGHAAPQAYAGAQSRRAEPKPPPPPPLPQEPALPPAQDGPLPGQGLPISGPLAYPLLIQVENTAPSRPQAGLQPASLVFQYVTEGGITRFSAIYHRVPGVVGPVRSARFISQYLYHRFQAVLMASGASDAALTRVVRDPGITGGFFNDYSPQYFFRWGGRAAPHNVYTRQDQMLAVAGLNLRPPIPADIPRSDQWAGTEPAPSVEVPALRASFDYGGGSYSVTTDGQPQVDVIYGPVRAQAVIVMHVRQFTTAEIEDSNGVHARDFDLNSGGGAEIYAKGTVIHGRWGSPDDKLPLRYEDGAGNQVRVPPGLVWVLLAE